jgi:DNA-binding transcriptional MerR regulator
MTLAAEEARIKHLFDRVEKVEEVAAAPNLDDKQRAVLQEVAHQALLEGGPVRVSIAAQILDLSERTVRSWAKEGVLVAAESPSSRVLLDPECLHEVLHLIRDIRARGRDRNLLEHVWYRLSDQALRERTDLQDSLAQMRRGEGRLIRSREGKVGSPVVRRPRLRDRANEITP